MGGINRSGAVLAGKLYFAILLIPAILEITNIYPQSTLLKTHVAFFYFLRSDDPAFESRYYAFPHTSKPLNIHRQVDYTIGAHSIEVFEKPDAAPLAILQGRFEQPLYIRLSGRMDKVTIIFKPLGLGHFVDQAFGDIANSHSQVFCAWNQLPAYHQMIAEFYQTNDLEQRAGLLEQFLLGQYRPLRGYETMKHIIEMVEDVQADYTIAEIAAASHMSEKTLNRQFQKYTAFTPVAYRKIARFRHSLENRLFNDKLSSLTQVGYESNYYDQSYFNRIYKNLTGKNPGKFFRTIEQLADKQVIFEFLRDMDNKPEKKG
jgi:AraC-like DNA-binding protein